MDKKDNHSIEEILRDMLNIIKSLNKSKEKATLNIGELAEYSGLSEDKIRQLIHTDDFPCFRNGNKWLINRDLFNNWLKEVSISHRQL